MAQKINMFLSDTNGGLYQWDIGQRLRLYGVASGARVDYVMGAQTLSVDSYADGGDVYADIPNILLQESGGIKVLVYVTGEDYGETVCERRLNVLPRAKPSDYVYTETEVKTYDDLEARVSALEENPISEDDIAEAVADYLSAHPVEETDPTVPAWAKEPEKPTYTAEDVGALPVDTVIPTVPDAVSAFENDAGYLTQDDLQAATDAALAQAKASGEFDGAKGDKGDTGATPDIQIGTVTTLAAGSDATASITGTPEEPLLNLGIPKGADGSPGGGGTADEWVDLGVIDASTADILELDFGAPFKRLILKMKFSDTAGEQYNPSTTAYRTIQLDIGGSLKRINENLGMVSHAWQYQWDIVLTCEPDFAVGGLCGHLTGLPSWKALPGHTATNDCYNSGYIYGILLTPTLPDGAENITVGSVHAWGVMV